MLEGGFQFSLEGMDHSVHTHYGLTVVILPGEQLGIRVSYDRERFEAATVQRLLGHIASLVRSMLAAPRRRWPASSCWPPTNVNSCWANGHSTPRFPAGAKLRRAVCRPGRPTR
ncbi:hypothetical protein THH46_13070 [Pseudomonas sp. NA13]